MNDLRKKMDLFRLGGPLPQEYIDLHEKAARSDLPRFLSANNLTLITSEMKSDGWGDGMRVLHVAAADLTKDEIIRFRWSSSNGGSWFSKSGALMEVPEERPGWI